MITRAFEMCFAVQKKRNCNFLFFIGTKQPLLFPWYLLYLYN